MNFFKKRSWSPYLAGAIVGFLQIPAFLLIGKTLGASNSFSVIVDKLLDILNFKYFAPEYFNNPKIWWQVPLLIGVIFGSFISAKLSGMKREKISPVWKEVILLSSFSKRYFMAFIGGAMLVFGALIADGCASGHGLSGLARLQLSSVITVLAFFGAGILTSQFMKKIK